MTHSVASDPEPDSTHNPRTSWGWLRSQVRARMFLIVCLLFGLIFYVTFFARQLFYTIDSGHAGVVFRRFFGGTVISHVRDEGFQILAPWDKLFVYDVRVQQIEHTFHILSNDGLVVNVTVSIRYHPRVELLGVLHKEVGPDYLDKIVIPEVQALIRQVFGQYTPEEIYTTKRSLIDQTLQGALGEVGHKYLVLDDLLIKSIKLPPLIEGAIQAKLVEEQRALEMRFRLAREVQEADRKVIEADGVNQAQAIIRRSLNEQILQYKGIEATLAMATSANAKIVLVGGKDGLPLILNTESISPGGGPVNWTNLMGRFSLTNLDVRLPSEIPFTNLPSARLGFTNFPSARFEVPNQALPQPTLPQNP